MMKLPFFYYFRLLIVVSSVLVIFLSQIDSHYRYEALVERADSNLEIMKTRINAGVPIGVVEDLEGSIPRTIFGNILTPMFAFAFALMVIRLILFGIPKFRNIDKMDKVGFGLFFVMLISLTFAV